MWILFSRIASAFREWWYFSRLSRIRSGRRRGRKVYESWVMVKIPLLWNFFRSFPVMFANKLRSSFSRAFCRQRSWNSHSLQCRFRTRSGGEALVATSAIFGASFRTSSNKPSVLTFNVVCSSPWMILPKLTSRPSNSDNPSESNANNKRSSRVSLFLKLKRIGTNFAGLPLPSDTTRSIACSRDSKSRGPGRVCTSDVPSAVWPGVASRLLCGPESPSEPARADTEKSTASSHLAAFRFSPGGGATTHSPSGTLSRNRLTPSMR